MEDSQRLEQTVAKMQRQLNEGSGGSGDQKTELGAKSPVEFKPLPVAPPTPAAANQLRNGDYSHSISSWNDAVLSGDDRERECAWWWSNDKPYTGQILDFSTGGASKSLKAVAHAAYDARQCDWGLPEGVARLTGNKSLDAPFPTNAVFPGRAMYLGISRIAKRNSTIRFPSGCHLTAALWNNSAGDYIKADTTFKLTATPRGTPSGTTERRYRLLIRTDRGYSILSDELVVAAAPDDASFTAGVVEFLSWEAVGGALEYVLYRFDVTAAKYRELYHVTTGNTNYGDNNHQDKPDVGGYPAGTDDRVSCYVGTLDGELDSLPVAGIALEWGLLFLNIPVPGKLSTIASGKQVFRLWLSKAMDREMTDAVAVSADNTVDSETAEFTSLDVGRTAILTSSDGLSTLTTTIASVTTSKEIELTAAPSFSSTGCSLYIVEGGDHGLVVDLVHIGYLSRAGYGPYPDDLNRTLLASASPNSSSQGGVGGGGDTGNPGEGGIGGCVTLDMPIVELYGNGFISRAFRDIRRGAVLRSGSHVPNTVIDILLSETDTLYTIHTANGVELECSARHRVFTSFMDQFGTQVFRLQNGDFVLTCVDGRDECSRIIEIQIATGKRFRIGTPKLAPGNRYLAGRVIQKWWRFWRRHSVSGIYSHNEKSLE